MVVTGVTGLLGRYLVAGAPENAEIHGFSRGDWPSELSTSCEMHRIEALDVPTVQAKLHALQPDVVIHAAAEGNPDIVEGQFNRFRVLNAELAGTLGSACFKLGAKLVFVSSNAVFSGSNPPYSDDSTGDPINDYGRLKWEAERRTLAVDPSALVVRPILMYGWPYPGRRENVASGWLKVLRGGGVVRAAADVWTEPLAAWDCAEAIWNGIFVDARGSVNVSGGSRMSIFEFARLLAVTFRLDPDLVAGVSIDQIRHSAERPRDTQFTLDRLRRELLVTPSVPDVGLSVMREIEDLGTT